MPNSGSVNSIVDMNGGVQENEFFQIVRDSNAGNTDQRAAATPHIKNALRGQDISSLNDNKQERERKVSSSHNATENIEEELVTASPRVRQKSHKISKKDKHKTTKAVSNDNGILKIFRGNKGDSNEQTSTEHTLSVDEKQRRKAIVYYDCQSIGSVSLKINTSVKSAANTATGASAASIKRSNHPVSKNDEDNDDGDGKENHLLLSCPFFRNELGSEKTRMIGLVQSNARRAMHMMESNQSCTKAELIDDPKCNSVAVLDPVIGSNSHVVETGVVVKKGYVIEHVDEGAYYYRNFFSGTDHQNYFGIDDNIGPIAISLRREKLLDRPSQETSPCYQHRFIIRTSEVRKILNCLIRDKIDMLTIFTHRTHIYYSYFTQLFD